ncbi:MAG: hypothetical protein HQM15_11915 [Deltaproteobacteria bacterium]|nr:hypothetical protein [Deltaproteobacteria bacterium]
MQILAATLNKIKELLFLKEEFKSFEGKLFYNIDSHFVLKNLYETIKEKHPDQMHYLNAKSGFNALKRCWEANQHCNTQQLIEFIREKKIKTIFSINMYFLENALGKENLLLVPLLNHLGIEFVVLDSDTYELNMDGYTLKAIQNTKGVRRFSFLPYLCKYFDQAAEAKEIRYCSCGDIYEPNQLIQAPKPNYEIYCIANSRTHHVLEKMPQVFYFMNCVDSGSPFEDQQMLFCAMNHLLLHSSHLDFEQKKKYYSLFANIYLGVLSLLKYEVIEGIESSQKILLFGDTEWAKLFPQYYQRYLNPEEMKERLQNGSSVYIHFNQNHSYFENNFVFLYSLNFAVPYLGFPVGSSLPELSGLRHLEYSNLQELNIKLKNIGALCKNPEYQNSFLRIKSYLKSCHNDFIDQIEDPNIKSSLYDNLCNENEQIFQQKLELYIKNNFYRITQCMDELMNKKREEFQIHQYSYFHKPYIQNLLSNFGRSAS